MFRQLGRLIDKRPWLVISIVLLITIGFATLIPGLEFKTDFQEFMPEDEVVQANMDILEKFGQSQAVMLLYIETQQATNILSPESLKEINYIEKELLKIPEVESSLSLNTLIEQVCFLEYGEEFQNCSDEQIRTIINDILNDNVANEIKILKTDDSNEAVDYNRYPRISKGKSIDEIDIKNCYIAYNQDSFTFTFEVYDLEAFESKLKSPIAYSNIVEWYLDFEIIIRPDERLDIDYKITAHIEPKHNLWEIGKGPLKNIISILQKIKGRELFNTYKKEVYLWVKLPEQPMSFPLKLETGNVFFDIQKNQIKIDVSKEELGKYCI